MYPFFIACMLLCFSTADAQQITMPIDVVQLLSRTKDTQVYAQELIALTRWMTDKTLSKPSDYRKRHAALRKSIVVLTVLCADEKKQILAFLDAISDRLSGKQKVLRGLLIAAGVATVAAGISLWLNKKKRSPRSRAMVAAKRTVVDLDKKIPFYTPPLLIEEADKRALEAVMPSDDIVRDAQKRIRNVVYHYRWRKDKQLKRFVASPDKQSANKFERVAWIIAQIPAFSAEQYAKDAMTAAPLMDERMRAINIDRVAMVQTLSTDRPYELLEKTAELHDQLVAQLSHYGKVTSLKPPSRFNQFFMELDGAFVFKFIPEGCGDNDAVIIKADNPFKLCKLQEWFRDRGMDGESHSVRRNAERVLAAADIRAAQGSSKITAPEKWLAVRRGGEEQFLDDRTTVVITDFVQSTGTLWPGSLSAEDVAQIKYIAKKHQLPDLHPLNFVKGKGGVWYLIDVEKNHAKLKVTDEIVLKNLKWIDALRW
ncbi:MAG: hypothetical protein QG604_473 [Candidatus Dependentiae bacterium]|nr:hypothetical protein [Candidatus Dependentiae bacterium]